jgi:hypothetical protein
MKSKKSSQKTGTQKRQTKLSELTTRKSGVTPTSKTDLTDYFRKPNPRKGRKGTKYHKYAWFEKQIASLPKGKDKKDWQEWLKDPENGLTW